MRPTIVALPLALVRRKPRTGWWPMVRSRIRRWRERARTRRSLAALDARGLADIGISEWQRRQECARRFWE